MRKTLKLIFLTMLFPIALYAQKNVIDEVVWVVGDEVILKSQVEEQYRNMQYERQKIEGDPYCFIPEQMAIQKLFLHQASIDSIYADDAQVSQEVEGRINYFIANIGSKEKVEEYFKKPMPELKELLTEMIRDQSVVQEMQRTLVKNVKVTPTEVRRYYDDMPKDSIPFIPNSLHWQFYILKTRVPLDKEERQDLQEKHNGLNHLQKQLFR